MAQHTDSSAGDGYCAQFHYAVELIGRRWSGAILVALRAGRTRYSEVRGAVPGLSDHLLCQRLRELEANGLLERCVTPTTPVQVRYELTPMGQALGPVIDELSAWASQWLPAEHQRVHERGPASAAGPSGLSSPRSRHLQR